MAIISGTSMRPNIIATLPRREAEKPRSRARARVKTAVIVSCMASAQFFVRMIGEKG